MHSISKAAILLAMLALATANSYYCNCGFGSGEECCHPTKKDCTPMVVRPVDIPRPLLPNPAIPALPTPPLPLPGPPLIPIGGPCTCHATLVKPAVLPKPQCQLCCSKTVQHQHTCTSNQNHNVVVGGLISGPIFPAPGAPVHYPQPLTGHPVLMHDLSNPAQMAPADAVSLAIAYKQAQENCDRSEGRLAFGFKSIPKDVPVIKKKHTNLREENLFNLNGQIVELKKVENCAHKSVDEEALDELMEVSEEDKIGGGVHPKTLTLGELGYGPAKIKAAPFINVPVASPIRTAVDYLFPEKKCEDGFKPGNVAIEHIPKPSLVSMPLPYPEPCPPERDTYIPPPQIVTPTCGCSSYASQASSNKYSSSSSSVLLHKLGSF